jgi:hypothetical protein
LNNFSNKKYAGVEIVNIVLIPHKKGNKAARQRGNKAARHRGIKEKAGLACICVQRAAVYVFAFGLQLEADLVLINCYHKQKAPHSEYGA